MKLSIFIFITLFCTSVQAELLGMIPGRSARIKSHGTTSIELGASWYTQQLQWTAVRLNVKPSAGLSLFMDYAKLHVSKLPINSSVQTAFYGYGVGGGLIFSVPDFLPSYDFAFKGAYHASVSNNKNGVAEPLTGIVLYQAQMKADFIVSPIDPLFENGSSWYGTAGYVSTGAHAKFTEGVLSGSDPISYRGKSGWAAGVGIVSPFSAGSVYAGVEWLSGDPLIAGGVRYEF